MGQRGKESSEPKPEHLSNPTAKVRQQKHSPLSFLCAAQWAESKPDLSLLHAILPVNASHSLAKMEKKAL